MSKKWKVLLIGLLAFALVVACFEITSQLNAAKNDDKQILRLTEPVNFVNLDSATATDTTSFNILNNVGEGLMRMGKDHRPIYGLAESVKISVDRKVYTFRLREGIKWNDGQPIRAQDFEYAWKRVLDPELKAQKSNILFCIAGAEAYHNNKVPADQVGVTARDDKTLEVRLKKPTLNFLSMLTLPVFQPQRKEFVEKLKNHYGKKPETVAYSGPFTVTKISPQKMMLVKNANYWDRDNVRLKQIDIHFVKDTATEIRMYNTNQSDMARLDQEFAEGFKQSPDYLYIETARIQYLLLNQKNKFFKNANIRRAITLAINRSVITDEILKDGSKPAGSLVPPTITGMGTRSFRQMSGGEIVTPDVRKARAYFQKGLKELGLSKPPKGLQLLSYDDSRRKIAISIKKQLKDNLGLEIKLNSPPSKIKFKMENTGQFDMVLSRWRGDFNDPFNFLSVWVSKNPLNHMEHKNPHYDRLINHAQQSPAEREKLALLIQAERTLISDQREAAIIPLFYIGSAYLQKPYVKNLYRHPYGPDYTLKWAYISDKKE
ncbi:peptide ABC transporter substrate-binding protein [Lihuaxuella thermophila]|uniref:Oligopeptide transport system substrate-binding protein n=1 Tax=Lihuaxuella thermophila TaxID=1173111 RepID=A0A1H8CCP4_9BACL|nr:peptide ABC transporter substrate-binding protein [Lihuaxuella thermophila]SEM92038.1 oligopeptide transport system substrate-binding protein [Lihuaxuella thermophila]